MDQEQRKLAECMRWNSNSTAYYTTPPFSKFRISCLASTLFTPPFSLPSLLCSLPSATAQVLFLALRCTILSLFDPPTFSAPIMLRCYAISGSDRPSCPLTACAHTFDLQRNLHKILRCTSTNQAKDREGVLVSSRNLRLVERIRREIP